MTLTKDEEIFVRRMAPHVEKGLSLEDAARAVIEDDERVWLETMTGHHREEIKSALAAQVYHAIRSKA